MSTSRVDRVHVRCRAPRSRERAALALRERLAATARTHLPEALERRLGAGGRRVFVRRVDHRLDFDPGAYDDVTVATLWAEAIAREIDGAGIDGADVRVFADDESFAAAAALEVARRGALPWWFEELPCGAGRVPARLVLAALGEPARATAALRALAEQPAASLALARRLEPWERALLAAVLAARLPWPTLGLSPTAARAELAQIGALPRRAQTITATEPAGRRDAAAAAVGDPAGTGVGAAGARTASGTAPGTAELAALIARAAAPGAPALRFDTASAAARATQRQRATPFGAADRRRPARQPTDARRTAAPDSRRDRPAREATAERRAWWSNAGGLVHLYPWLGDLLTQEPPLEPHERGWALGALADPGAGWPLSDPLVRVLAGEEPEPENVTPRFPDEQRLAADSAAADTLLASFAALLPGFERSSAAYLRTHVVGRAALIEPLEDGGIRVLLEPSPLDPVLARLPYPLVPFRLPWSTLIVPELRRA